MLTDAAACGTDRLRFSRRIDNQPAELANEFAPGRGFQTQSLQDWLHPLRSAPALVSMKLTSRPVEQTQVIRQRNWQEPFIAATTSALGWIRSGLRRSGGFQPPQIGLLSFDRASQRREQSVSLAEPRCHRTFGRLRREPGTSSVVGRRLKKSAGRRFACAAGYGLNEFVLRTRSVCPVVGSTDRRLRLVDLASPSLVDTAETSDTGSPLNRGFLRTDEVDN